MKSAPFIVLLTLLSFKQNSQVIVRTPALTILIQKKIELASGNVGSLFDKTIGLKFDYEYMAVCNFESEAAYLENIKKKKRKKKADRLIRKWTAMSKEMLEPNFQSYFNRSGEKIGLFVASDNMPTQGTLIVKVLKQDPHYHGDTPPALFIECTFLDGQGFFLARLNLQALAECYSRAGRMLANDIVKRVQNPENQD